MTERKKFVAEAKMDDLFKNWLNNLYDTTRITDEEMNNMWEAFRYQGFNRDEVLMDFFKKTPDNKIATQLIVLCAIQGPRRAAETPLLNGQTPKSLGIPASDMQRKKGISCQRITAATADLAAFYLKKLNVAKRLNMECPGWLQFPSAGSIKLPSDLREQHIAFAKKFSQVIGGEFNESIYQQMVNNSYYDHRLNLF